MSVAGTPASTWPLSCCRPPWSSAALAFRHMRIAQATICRRQARASAARSAAPNPSSSASGSIRPSRTGATAVGKAVGASVRCRFGTLRQQNFCPRSGW